jgi:ABC-type multidrug transport system fused ATPase/permease subunit
MLIRLLRTHLQPYRGWLAIVVVLQFVAVVAMLYLPSLNADIIDNGIVTGDTGYIVRLGALMLAVSFVQIICSGSGSARAPRWAWAATSARPCSTASAASRPARSSTSGHPR